MLVATWPAPVDSSDIFFWMRAGWGLLGPLALYPMVWGTVRIRSTMAATGILYVDVVAVVIGEVLGGWLSAARAHAVMTPPLTIDDDGAYAALRAESLLDTPFAFASSPEDDAATETLRRGGVIFGAFEGDRLIGIVGIGRARHVRGASRVRLGHVRHAGRSTPRRGDGAHRSGDRTRAHDGRRRLGATRGERGLARRATRLRARGVRGVGEGDHALRVNGEAFDEDHMALRL